MKILYVYGDDDYAALTFCDDLHLDKDSELIRLWNESASSGVCVNHAFPEIVVDEDEGICCQALEFDNVDPAFIDWIKYGADFIDYDESKSRDFFVVK